MAKTTEELEKTRLAYAKKIFTAVSFGEYDIVPPLLDSFNNAILGHVAHEYFDADAYFHYEMKGRTVSDLVQIAAQHYDTHMVDLLAERFHVVAGAGATAIQAYYRSVAMGMPDALRKSSHVKLEQFIKHLKQNYREGLEGVFLLAKEKSDVELMKIAAENTQLSIIPTSAL